MRPEPAGPVSRTERPRASSRTSRSRSSSRSSSGSRGAGGPGRHGRLRRRGRSSARSAARALLGPAGPLARRAGLYLAAVDGVDGEQEVARDELDGAGERRRVLAEVRRAAASRGGRAGAAPAAVVVMAVLLGSPVVRVHRSKPPRSVVCRMPLPALLHTALSLLVRCPLAGLSIGGRPNPRPSHSISDSRGAAPSETSQSREDCDARRTVHARDPQAQRFTPGAATPPRCRPRSPGCGAAGWPPAVAASAAARRAAPAGGRTGRPAGGRP